MRKRWISPSFDSTETNKRKYEFKNGESSTSSKLQSVPHSSCSNTWIEKYEPQMQSDLVIHPKKLEEMQTWFNKYKNHPDSCKYILLTGPPGTGKTASMRIIAKSNDIQVLEWITPLDREYNPDFDIEHESPLKIFRNFLMRACRYPTLFAAQSFKVILIKDFPNIILHSPSSFHELLIEFNRMKSHAVVFVCNDEKIARKLFPDEIKKTCNIETINFNPVHCKAVIKALKRIVTLENKINTTVIKDSHLERIYHQTGGDLRSAILKLYFKFVKLQDTKLQDIKNEESKGTLCNASKSLPEIRDKDEICDLFVGLGRVLYAKKDNSNGNDKFVYNADNITDNFLSQINNFKDFLHENYMTRFSKIEDISKAAKTFSITDSLLTSGNYNENIDRITLSTLTRSLMAANSSPVKSFKPFVKSRYHNIQSRKCIIEKIRFAFPSLKHHASSDIILFVLPFMKEIFTDLNKDQKDIISNNLFNRDI